MKGKALRQAKGKEREEFREEKAKLSAKLTIFEAHQ